MSKLQDIKRNLHDADRFLEDTKRIMKGLPVPDKKGIGKVDSFGTHYPFSADNVKEFAEFCEESGGFEIW